MRPGCSLCLARLLGRESWSSASSRGVARQRAGRLLCLVGLLGRGPGRPLHIKGLLGRGSTARPALWGLLGSWLIGYVLVPIQAPNTRKDRLAVLSAKARTVRGTGSDGPRPGAGATPLHTSGRSAPGARTVCNGA
jgi:hypothetical protein